MCYNNPLNIMKNVIKITKFEITFFLMCSCLINNKIINMGLIIIGKHVYFFIKLFIYKIQQIVIKNKIKC